MSGKDLLPGKDSDFDTLQEALLKAVNDNATAWKIPTAEINPLNNEQAEWTAAWNIARNKYNCNTTQRAYKDRIKKEYKKALRPFIQRWVYRNGAMNSADIEKCGLLPRKKRGDGSHEPTTPEKIDISRGSTGILMAQCNIVRGAEEYGCIMVVGRQLPASVKFNHQGQLLIAQEEDSFPAGKLLFMIDLNKSRKKTFTGLKPGTDYYFYFYTVNFRGVSRLSEFKMLKCW